MAVLESSHGMNWEMTMLPLKQALCDGGQRGVSARPDPGARAERSRARKIFGGGAVANCTLAACSALTAEFLAGCAAYADAMYPSLDQRDEPGRRFTGTDGNVCVVVYSTGLWIEGTEVGLPSWRRGPAALVHREVAESFSARPYPIRTWYRSISAMAVSLRDWMRDRRAMRSAMFELERLDDRALRDIGLIRLDGGRAIRSDLDLR